MKQAYVHRNEDYIIQPLTMGEVETEKVAVQQQQLFSSPLFNRHPLVKYRRCDPNVRPMGVIRHVERGGSLFSFEDPAIFCVSLLWVKL